MAILFYLLFRAGFISPATPAAETNAYGFAAISGLVGLFSARAAQMLERIADIVFTKAVAGAGTVSPGDFNLTVSGSPQTVAPGDTATYAITVTATQDFSASITLTCAVDPVRNNRPTVTLNPTVCTPATTGTPVTLTIMTTVDTPPGAYKTTITATGGGKTHTVEAILTVQNGRGADGAPPTGDFTLSVPEAERTISPGESARYTTVATASGGFSQPVTLIATGLPTGSTVAFNPPSLLPTPEGASSELTVQVNDATPPIMYEIEVTATGGGKTQETSVQLTITASEAARERR